MSSDITMVELSRLESLTFSLRRLRLPVQALSAHVHMGACGASRPGHWKIGGEGANAVDLEPIGTAHPFGPPIRAVRWAHEAQWTPWTCPTR